MSNNIIPIQKGVLNKITESYDFFQEFVPVKLFSINVLNPIVGETKYEATLEIYSSFNDFIKIKLTNSSFYYLSKVYGGDIIHDYYIPPFSDVFNGVINFYDIEPILGYIGSYKQDSEGDLYFSNVIFKKGNEFLCLDIRVSDLLAFSASSGLLLFINKDIVIEKAITKKEIEEEKTKI